jgi:hypothetical protein
MPRISRSGTLAEGKSKCALGVMLRRRFRHRHLPFDPTDECA